MDSERIALAIMCGTMIAMVIGIVMGVLSVYRQDNKDRIKKSTDIKDTGRLIGDRFGALIAWHRYRAEKKKISKYKPKYLLQEPVSDRYKVHTKTVSSEFMPLEPDIDEEPEMEKEPEQFTVHEPPRHLAPENRRLLDAINMGELYSYEEWLEYAELLPDEMEFVTDPFGSFSTSASDGFSYHTPSLFWLRVREGASGRDALWRLVEICKAAREKYADDSKALRSLTRDDIVVLVWRQGAENILADGALVEECKRLGIIPALWVSCGYKMCVLDLLTGELNKQSFETNPCGVDLSGDSTDYDLGDLGSFYRRCYKERFYAEKPTPTPEELFSREI